MSYTSTPIPGRIYPADPELFKARFINQKRAYVRGKKPDGSFVMRSWRHIKLKQTSDLQWNLNTGFLNPENWDTQIVFVDIAIDPNDFPN